ncbi:uncharacterized protein STEHIDRAFT_62871, partial [Stereum hirsutum FP-91666 SS1]|uniref:uncharacterized protein n=1 Tax=Stereum hirsutum (strain FP-91666) TaxID=721885 RepID=UPI000444A156
MHDVPVPRHREVRAFEAEALQPINAEITGLQYIGSYSWVKASTPTIAVPGTPRRWVDKPLPITLKADDVATFVDSNGHRAPSAPLLPLFLAVDATMNTSASASATSTSTQVEWPSIDVITDRNGLRKLLGWTTGSSRRKEWRIDMQLVGTKTVLFNRREPSTAVAPMPGGATFGHAFEMKMTKPQAKGVGRELDGHHRIVRYDFGGLCMVVRFEVDAFIPESS